jgi:hypothetical protein
VNFNYFLSDEVFRYVVNAVALVAEHGHRLAPHYRFDTVTGLWHHRDGTVEPPLRLAQLQYDEDGELTYPRRRDTTREAALAGYLADAEALLLALPPTAPDAPITELGPDFEHLRWFELPAESLQ